VENIRVIKQPNILQQAPKALDRKETHRILRETDRRGNLRDYAIVVLLLNMGLLWGNLYDWTEMMWIYQDTHCEAPVFVAGVNCKVEFTVYIMINKTK
jgi:site-specific recombinase XerC